MTYFIGYSTRKPEYLVYDDARKGQIVWRNEYWSNIIDWLKEEHNRLKQPLDIRVTSILVTEAQRKGLEVLMERVR